LAQHGQRPARLAVNIGSYRARAACINQKYLNHFYIAAVTAQQAYQLLSSQLSRIYDTRESANIADIVIGHISNEKKIDRLLNRNKALNADQQQLLADCTEKLLQHQPVQYVLHEAWFGGLKLYVDENVLIPRPETEELVDWILSNSQLTTHNSPLTILDIGTGSGCIAIALKKKLPSSQLSALDISEAALKTARRNAVDNNTQINFFRADILHEEEIENFGRFDVIVSNPPYVKRNEAEEMRTNVFLYEPHVALFVPDEDALLFYRHVARFAISRLRETGCVYVELNELLAGQVADLFHASGLRSVQIKKDMQGKDRMIKATRGG